MLFCPICGNSRRRLERKKSRYPKRAGKGLPYVGREWIAEASEIRHDASQSLAENRPFSFGWEGADKRNGRQEEHFPSLSYIFRGGLPIASPFAGLWPPCSGEAGGPGGRGGRKLAKWKATREVSHLDLRVRGLRSRCNCPWGGARGT